jgi:uncharacterized protein (DUF2336 family)
LIRADFTFALRPVVNVRQPGTTRASPWKAAGSILPKTRNVAGRVRHRRAQICSRRGLERSTHRNSQARGQSFLGNADDFNGEQVGLFDDVLGHLIRQVETTALAELGAKLAPVNNAPNGVIRSLAYHDEIAVAGPVLGRSVQLTDRDLVEIAGSKGQAHLGAISERTRLVAAVSDPTR